MVKASELPATRRNQRQPRLARELPAPPEPAKKKPSRGFLLRLPEAYYDELQERAADEGVSMNQLVLRILYESLKRQ